MFECAISLFSMEITWCSVDVDVRPVSRFISIFIYNVTTCGGC